MNDLSHGKPYPYNREEAHFYRESLRGRARQAQRVNPGRATQDIVRKNDPATDRGYLDEDMLIGRRIAKAVYEAEEDWSPGLIIKMFMDLDRLFFMGSLIGKVKFEWVDGDKMAANSSGRSNIGLTFPPNSDDTGRVKVWLNADLIILSKDSKQPFRQMWSTILHKLVHAYSFIRCGIYSNNGHDEHFRTMIHAIHRHSWPCYQLKVIDDWEPYKYDHFMSEYWTRGEVVNMVIM